MPIAFKAFLTLHKTIIGSLFLAYAGWSMTNGCPHVLGYDPIALTNLNCENFKDIALVLGSLLVGAGVIDKDAFFNLKRWNGVDRRDVDNTSSGKPPGE